MITIPFKQVDVITQVPFFGNPVAVVLDGAHAPGQSARIEVRAFAPSCGVNEDPVCGSGNGCVAVFIRETGQVERFGETFLSSPGRVVGRAGSLRIASLLSESRSAAQLSPALTAYCADSPGVWFRWALALC